MKSISLISLKHLIFLRLDEELFVLQCKETSIKVAIDWKEVRDTHTYLRKSDYDDLLTSLDQRSLKKHNKKLNIFDDCGFHSNMYGEYLLTFDSLLDHYYYYEKEFKIGDIEIEISEPSNLYRVLFSRFTLEDTFGGWSDLGTVRVHGFSYRNLESILQQVLLLIAINDSPEEILTGDYPQIVPYMYEGDNISWNSRDQEELWLSESNEYPVANYFEPISFYNKAMRLEEPIYFYRVIEYFFIINLKSNFEKMIESYNKSNNIDLVIQECNSIYSNREVDLLKNLLSNIKGISELVKFANEIELIHNLETSTWIGYT